MIGMRKIPRKIYLSYLSCHSWMENLFEIPDIHSLNLKVLTATHNFSSRVFKVLKIFFTVEN